MKFFSALVICLPWTFVLALAVAPNGMLASFDNTLKGILLCSSAVFLFRAEARKQWIQDRMLWVIALFGCLAVASNLFSPMPEAMQHNESLLRWFGNPARGDAAFWWAAVTIYLLSARANKISELIMIPAAVSSLLYYMVLGQVFVISHAVSVALAVGGVVALNHKRWLHAGIFGFFVFVLQDRTTMMMFGVGALLVAWEIKSWRHLIMPVVVMVAGQFMSPMIGRGDRTFGNNISDLPLRLQINQWGLDQLHNDFVLGHGELATSKYLMENPGNFPAMLIPQYALDKRPPHTLIVIQSDYGVPLRYAVGESGWQIEMPQDRALNWFLDTWLQHGLLAMCLLFMLVYRAKPVWRIIFLIHALLWQSFELSPVYLLFVLVAVGDLRASSIKSPTVYQANPALGTD